MAREWGKTPRLRPTGSGVEGQPQAAVLPGGGKGDPDCPDCGGDGYVTEGSAGEQVRVICRRCHPVSGVIAK